MADGGHRIIVFIKVETDQPGLIGWGEATLEGKPRALVGCTEDMAPMIMGQDPRRIEHCWQTLYRSGFWRMGVIGLSVISGIDQALWDIKGKDLGVPVYELLGGRVRDKVRVYTHFGGRTPDEMAESALSKKAKGWTAIKTVPVPITNIIDGPKKLKQAEAGLRAVREAVGDEVDILLDMHGRLTPQMAIQYAKRFEPYHPAVHRRAVPGREPGSDGAGGASHNDSGGDGRALVFALGFPRDVGERRGEPAATRPVPRRWHQRDHADWGDGDDVLRRACAAQPVWPTGNSGCRSH